MNNETSLSHACRRCRLYLRVWTHLKSTLRVINRGPPPPPPPAPPQDRLGLRAMTQLAEVGQSLCVTSLSRQTGYSGHISENVAPHVALEHQQPGGGPERILTSLLGGLVIRLAHQPAVLHQVVLVTCGQLPFAHDAGETVEVVDEVLRSPHHLRGWNPLLARCALGSESPFLKGGGNHTFDISDKSPPITEGARWCGIFAPYLKKSSLQ